MRPRRRPLPNAHELVREVQAEGPEEPGVRMRVLLAGLAVVAGIALVAYGGRAIYRAEASQGWPATTGFISSSRIETTRSRRAVARLPHVEFRYRVNGREYLSDVISFGALSGSAREVIERYPSGRDVTVHYDPKHPDVACVACEGPGWRDLTAPAAGILIVIAGLATIADSRRGRRPFGGRRVAVRAG